MRSSRSASAGLVCRIRFYIFILRVYRMRLPSGTSPLKIKPPLWTGSSFTSWTL